MSDLQVIFLIVGVLLFVGIAAYSWQQSQADESPRRDRGRRRRSASLDTAEGDALDGDDALNDALLSVEAEPSAAGAASRDVPTLSSGESVSRRATRAVAERLSTFASKKKTNRRVPSQSSATVAAERPASPAAPQHSKSKPETLKTPRGANSQTGIIVDLVARINIPEPLEQHELMTLLRQHDYKFHRAIHLYGLNQLTDRWCDVEQELSSAQFVDLGLSIQLADRQGAMSSKEAHDFQQMVLAFTDHYDAPFEFSMDVDEALDQARCLDQIVEQFDSMAVLNVIPRSRSGFRVADVESCARDLILSPDANRIFLKTTGQRNDLSVQYRLACSDGKKHFGISETELNPIHDLVLYMNVSATSNPELVFQEMIDDANKLATWLEGKVVDASGKPLTQHSLNALLLKVSEIASGLKSLGIKPGDAISKKLF